MSKTTIFQRDLSSKKETQQMGNWLHREIQNNPLAVELPKNRKKNSLKWNQQFQADFRLELT